MGAGGVADLRGRLPVAVGPLRFAEHRAEERGCGEPAEHRPDGEREDAPPLLPQVVGGGGEAGLPGRGSEQMKSAAFLMSGL